MASITVPDTTAEQNGTTPKTPEVEFPLDSFKDAARHLRRPFTPAAVKFRILQGKGDRARCAAYIDARLAIERLNLVIPHLWQEPCYVEVTGGLRCDLTVDGLTRSDVGWSKGTGNDMDLKARYSDAFKRAAVHFGVGVSLYAVPALYLSGEAGEVKIVTKEGKPPQYYMRPSGERKLRGIYELWLSGHGAQAFGEPLDHGDVDQDPAEETNGEGDGNAEPEPPQKIGLKALAQLDSVFADYVEQDLPVDQLEARLVAAGVDQVDDVSSAFEQLTYDAGKALHEWLTGEVEAAKDSRAAEDPEAAGGQFDADDARAEA